LWILGLNEKDSTKNNRHDLVSDIYSVLPVLNRAEEQKPPRTKTKPKVVDEDKVAG
jgi:hypothetical protein